jgi:hypothetical protein
MSEADGEHYMAETFSRAHAQSEIVKTLIDTKAVDFERIGEVVARFGGLASVAMDDGDVFCGTGRHFIRLISIADPGAILKDVAELAALRGIGEGFRGGSD